MRNIKSWIVAGLLACQGGAPAAAQEYVKADGANFVFEQKTFVPIGISLDVSVWTQGADAMKSSLNTLAGVGFNAVKVAVEPKDKGAFATLLGEAERQGLKVVALLPLEWDEASLVAWLGTKGSGRSIVENPTLMSWEVSGHDLEEAQLLLDALRRYDKQHLIAIETDGIREVENGGADYEGWLGSSSDYFTVALRPLLWGWTSTDRTYDALPNVYVRTKEYLEQHARLAEKYEKPLLCGACSYPRDKASIEPASPAEYRKGYFHFVMQQLRADERTLQGIFFSTWAGEATEEKMQHLPHDNIYMADSIFLQEWRKSLKRFRIKLL